jgi:hypothetical protein
MREGEEEEGRAKGLGGDAGEICREGGRGGDVLAGSSGHGEE